MNDYLLDTNVVSELSKATPNQAVVDFLNTNTNETLWLSVIVVEEIEFGLQILPEGRRQDDLRQWLTQIVEAFDGRIAPVGMIEAEWAARFQARVNQNGGDLELADALIAGTAMANDMTVVTRNAKDFDGLDVEMINPWEPR